MRLVGYNDLQAPPPAINLMRLPAALCPQCHGTGRILLNKRFEVTIPRGIGAGQRIRLANQGGAGLNGGPSGDLYLIVRLREDPTYTRKGDDLYVDLPVTFAEAALGAEVQVTTVTGRVTTRIPGGVQSGQSLRLTGLGMPQLRGGGSGDLYARVKVTVPKNLTERERELIEELGDLRHENPRDRLLVGR